VPISIKDLPPIDIVLISHNHYDHLDLSALKKLVALYNPKIFAGLGVDTYLKTKGVNAIGMDWWNTSDLNKQVRITYTPSQHWSSRWGWDKNYTLWGGFMIDMTGFGQIYFAGDTGYNRTYLNQIRAKFPNIRLALLPIGAYKPRWFMAYAHMSPDEAVKAAITLESQQNIAIHYDVFNLANEEYGEAPKDLALALQFQGKNSEYFQALIAGQGISLNPNIS
jgi:L-ascorbate metabolism protein UlaG (beta-lactamase superfamily)